MSKQPEAGILTQGPAVYPPPTPTSPHPPSPCSRGKKEKGPQSGERFKPINHFALKKNIFIILSILHIICRAEGIRNFKTAQREAGLSRGGSENLPVRKQIHEVSLSTRCRCPDRKLRQEIRKDIFLKITQMKIHSIGDSMEK